MQYYKTEKQHDSTNSDDCAISNIGYTIEDFEKLPEQPRYELYDGELVMLARPSIVHQRTLGLFYLQFEKILQGKKCLPLIEPDVRLFEQRQTIFSPDLVIVCDQAKIHEKRVEGAPDLVVEIQSPSTAGRDRITKLNAYKDAGVREYWIIDPLNSTVESFYFEITDTPTQYCKTDKLKIQIFDDAEIDLTEIFE